MKRLSSGFSFMGRRKYFYMVSGAILLAGLISLIFQGLNLGIDFQGGAMWSLQFQQPVGEGDIREVMADHGVGEAVIQRSGSEADGTFLVRAAVMETARREALEADLAERLGPFEVLSYDEVSPTIGGEIRRKAVLALLVASVGMIIYITIRFEWRFGLSAIGAVLHDVFVLVSFVSIVQMPLDQSFVAAVLTIFGYSVNDTIVIFDRLRENIADTKLRRRPISQLIDMSIHQTLPRTINTSLTTFVAIAAVYLFGGPTLKDFSLVLLLGVLVGTYSSVAVASGLWHDLAGRTGGRLPSAPAQ